LLEAERHAMAMYTSCGWFFDDLGGIETIQNLRYAARVAQLLQPFTTEDLEGRLRADLEAARSNVEGASGAALFEARVRPDVYTPERTAATFGFLRFLDAGAVDRSLHGLAVRETEAECLSVGEARARRGLVWMRDRRTGAEHELSTLVIEAAARTLACHVTPADPERHRRLGAQLAALEDAPGDRAVLLAALYGGPALGIADLPAEDRRSVAARLAASRSAGLRQAYRDIWVTSRDFLQDFATMHLEPPLEIRLPCEFTLQADLDEALTALAPPFEAAALAGIAGRFHEAASLGLHLDATPLAGALAGHLRESMRELLHDRDPAHCEAAERLLELAESLGLSLKRAEAEELLYACLQREVVPRRPQPRAPAERALVDALVRLAARMGFEARAWEPAAEAPAALGLE
jgi:hypothetical protein